MWFIRQITAIISSVTKFALIHTLSVSTAEFFRQTSAHRLILILRGTHRRILIGTVAAILLPIAYERLIDTLSVAATHSPTRRWRKVVVTLLMPQDMLYFVVVFL